MYWIQTLAILLVAAAAFRCINDRFLHLQTTIAMVVLCLTGLIVIGIFEWAGISEDLGLELYLLVDLIDDADPSASLWMVLLSILLFATTMQVSINDLSGEKWFTLAVSILTLSLGTTIIGHVLPWALEKVDVDLSLFSGLLFGAMISVTCTSVVLEVLPKPPKIAALAGGESLFLVGLSALACTVMATAEIGDGGEFSEAGSHLVRELFRGGLVGAAIGTVGCFCISATMSVSTQMLVTLAVLYASCSLAVQYGAFGPVAAVVAGMVFALRKDVCKAVAPVWRSVEETLTVMLLVFVGVQLSSSSSSMILPIFVATLVVLAARAAAVALSTQLLRIDKRLGAKRWDVIKFLTWGGVHGGVPLALALTIPHEGDEEFLFLMFGVVVFSLVVQGLTVKRL